MWGERGRLWLTTIPSEEFPGIVLQVRVGGEGPLWLNTIPLQILCINLQALGVCLLRGERGFVG